MKVIFLCGLGLVFPVIIFLSLTDQPEQMSIEWELAIVNASDHVSRDHPTVNEFKNILDQFENKCLNSRQDIAKVCVEGYYYRKERGNLDTLMEFMQEVNAAIVEDSDDPVDIRELVARHIGLMVPD